jgi:hypothetical protein
MNFSSRQIREDMALVEASGLEEKFLKADDPTIVIGKFLEKAGLSMSAIQNAYNKKARDRNAIIGPVLKELQALTGKIMVAKSALEKHVDGTASPEDTNRSINKPGEHNKGAPLR